MAQQWLLEDGIKLARAIQAKCRTYGYHVALGGGVLNNGFSDKDLDLYFHPYNNERVAKKDPEGLVKWLTSLWGASQNIGADYPDDAENPYTVRAATPQNTLINEELYESYVDDNGNLQMRPRQVRTVQRATAWVPSTNRFKEAKTSAYTYKLKFHRVGGDRIDVFIV